MESTLEKVLVFTADLLQQEAPGPSGTRTQDLLNKCSHRRCQKKHQWGFTFPPPPPVTMSRRIHQSCWEIWLWDTDVPAFLLTVLLRLEGDLSAFLLALWIGQWQSDVDAVVRRKIAQREPGGVVLHRQTLPHRGVVASTSSYSGVAVAQGHRVGVAAGQVEGQVLPLQGQLPGLDVCGRQAAQSAHGLWEGRGMMWGKKEDMYLFKNVINIK